MQVVDANTIGARKECSNLVANIMALVLLEQFQVVNSDQHLCSARELPAQNPEVKRWRLSRNCCRYACVECVGERDVALGHVLTRDVTPSNQFSSPRT